MVMAVAVVLLAAGGCGAKRDAAKESPIVPPASVAQYEKTKDAICIEKAIEEMRRNGYLAIGRKPEKMRARKEIFTVWLQLLTLVERDENRKPPAALVRHYYSPGELQPDTPEFRAAVKQDEELRRWEERQWHLERVHMTLPYEIEIFVANSYAASTEQQREFTKEDRREFEKVLGKASIMATEQNALKAVAEGRKRPGNFQ